MSNGHFLLLFLGLNFLAAMLLSITDIGMADYGLAYQCYSQVFEEPAAASDYFNKWLTLIVGAAWNSMFGRAGIVAFHILESIMQTVALYIVYVLLRDKVNRWVIFAGAAMVLLSGSLPWPFHYNSFSCFLALATGLMLYKGLTSYEKEPIKKNLCFFLAGFTYALDVFARFPNIMLGIMVVAFLPELMSDTRRSDVVKQILLTIIGTIAGTCICLAAIKGLGHMPYFIASFNDMAAEAGETGTHHNIISMLGSYLKQAGEIAAIAFFFLLAPVTIILWWRKQWQGKLTAAIILIACAFAFYTHEIDRTTLIPMLYAVSFIAIITGIVQYRKQWRMQTLLVIAICIPLAMPFGSDTGVYGTAGIPLLLGLPLALGVIAKKIQSMEVDNTEKTFLKTYITLFCGSFIVIMTFNTIGNHAPWTKRFVLNAPRATTLVTYTEKLYLDKTIAEVNKYTGKGERLWCLDNVPLFNYLTNTLPYANTSWPWTLDMPRLRKFVMTAERRHDQLPVVLRSKGYMFHWDKYDPEWNNYHAKNKRTHDNAHLKFYHDFLLRNHYHKVWENKYFVILIPPRGR